MPGILERIGFEFESPTMYRECRLPDELRKYFKKDHDASIETPVRRRGEYIFTYNTNTVRTEDWVIGSEFVSIPLKVEDFPTAVKLLIGYLNSEGESIEAQRCGIHFHIAMAYNNHILKNLVQLSRNMEQVFYYIGGMGQEFRGIKNDFTYCRPVTKYGPSVVPNGNYYSQVYNVEDLLESKDTEMFWDRYGGMNEMNPPSKYHPARYGWITLYPLLTKGTVEFRVFNHTLESVYLIAASELCRKFCEISFTTLPELSENSIYDQHNKDQVIETLNNFSAISNLSNFSRKVLTKIIELTPEIDPPTKKYFHTHLRNSTFGGFSKYSPARIPEGVIQRPNFVDIHVLGR